MTPVPDASTRTYVALLRGVNVSGVRRVPMAELRQALEGAGLAAVRTHLQSGNVVFSATGAGARELAVAIQARIAETFGHEVGVVVLPAAELAAIADANPFHPAADADPRTLHVTFLDGTPEADALERATIPAGPGERAVLLGRAVYLLLPGGYGTTKLTNSYFERSLGMRATTRNWRTVTTLVAMAKGASDG